MMQNLMMELRKCCNHPYLFAGADPCECEMEGICFSPAGLQRRCALKPWLKALCPISGGRGVGISWPRSPFSCLSQLLHARLPVAGLPDPDASAEHLISSSGKLALLDRLMPGLIVKGHRALVYSQASERQL